MKEPVICKILKLLLYAVFVTGAAAIVTLPFSLEFYMDLFYDAYYLDPGYRDFILAFLMIVAVLALWVIAEMIGLLRTIPTDPFVVRNVRAFRRAGFLAMAIAVLFFLKCVVYATFLTMLCGVVLAICSLFVFTMGSLFRQAIAFKEENDLTI